MNKTEHENRIKELELELSNLKSGLTVIKKVEEKLREREHLLLTTFNAVNAPIFNLAVEDKWKYRFISINKAFCKVTGLKQEQVVGKLVNEVIPEPSLTMVLGKYKQAIDENRIIQWEETTDYPAGQLIGEVSIAPYFDENGRCVNLIGSVLDITERKKAEIRLAESNYFNAQIINNVQEGIIVIDKNMIHKVWNPFMEKLTGIPASMVIGKHQSEVFPVPGKAVVIEKLVRALNGEPIDATDFSFNLPETGKSGWASYKIIPVSDANGEIIEVIGTVHDITIRKHAEEALESEKQRLSSILEGTNAGTWEWNIQTGETKFNERWAELIGYTLEEISPVNIEIWKKYSHPDDLKIATELLEKHFRRELDYYECELRMKHKNGEWIWVMDRGQVHKWDEEGKPLLMSGTHQDINVAKKAEEELIVQKHFFEQMFMQSPVSTQILDSEGWCEKINPKLTELFGVNPENIEGRVYNIFKDEAIKQGGIIPYLERTFYEGKASEWDVLFDIGVAADSQGIEVKEKKKMWYSNWSFPILDKNGIVSKVILQHTDITDRKQAESELIKAKEKAEESDRLKSAFLANMSHEIRTPMNGILGFAELLKEPGLTSDEQQDFIQTIQISGVRMLNTINNIIDISKIESGLTKVDIEDTNINEKIEFTYKFFKPEVEKKGLKFTFNYGLPAKDAVVKTDNEKVYAVLTNLVKNAIKFTYEGSIEFGYNKKGGNIEFFVKDTGIGLPQEQQGLIFERFRQGSESLSRNYEGSGLGLSISKSYIEMLGGKMWLESEAGKGSIFYFTIPYNAGSEEKKEIIEVLSTERKDHEIRNLKILTVEDDEISYSLLKRMLQKISFEILHATTGIEAVEACRNRSDLDLVLMDIRMPNMDGNEATRQIRQFNKDVIIIAQTAYGFSNDREMAIEAGCNDYISKPINESLLYKLIKKYFTKLRIS